MSSHERAEREIALLKAHIGELMRLIRLLRAELADEKARNRGLIP